MLRLILSTDGKHERLMERVERDVPQVEDIHWSKTVFGPPTYGVRHAVEIELTGEQAEALIATLKALQWDEVQSKVRS